ncbi:AmmeMemoRadiSam system protein B [Patescibacteria group bacterium]|nr:AmmeMemoRadiSam system protein B [Patescibacteria group bacterium]MBU1629782.1 AmmeMemoRadiSam system protein B [Patescibacteria group bacterium]MBU1908297.1 AmmeMemoRadiSam system protein B [Patescibacteria group bacterium]
MRKLLGIITLIAAAITVAAFGYNFANGKSSDAKSSDVGRPPDMQLEKLEISDIQSSDVGRIPIDADRFLDLLRFRLSDAIACKKIEGRPIAGVVNHHALASDLLARFFKSLKLSRPDLKRLIIISPDHFKQGYQAVGFGDVDYQSDGKIIKTDKVLAETFKKELPEFDNEFLLKEHGIGALIPFAAREFSDLSILPIVVRADASRSELIKLGQKLASIMDGQTMVIISADMSHYLSAEQALKNDEVTLSWFLHNDGNALFRASDDNIDSGPALLALLTMFEQLKIEPQFTLLNHSISSRYGGSQDNTTSYITGFWAAE